MNPNLSKSRYTVELLHAEHQRSAFRCGIPTLDTFLKMQARQQSKKRLGATYVLMEVNTLDVIGYYTLSATSIPLESLPETVVKKFPRYPSLPALLLGRLAIHEDWQGHHLGATLLYDALKKSFDSSNRIGSMAVVVDAINSSACKFYIKHGFIPFLDKKNTLFLPMTTIKQLITNESCS